MKTKLNSLIVALVLIAPFAKGNIVATDIYSFGINYTNYDGATPSAGLVQGRDGNFYGATSSGGTNGFGTVFIMMTNGFVTTLYSFANSDGASPQSAYWNYKAR